MLKIKKKLKIPTVVNVNEITETIVVSSLAKIVDMPVTLSWKSK